MHVLVIGAGAIGSQLGKRLVLDKHDVSMIEFDPHRAKRAREQLDAMVIEGHGASFRALEEAGVSGVDIVAAMTDHDEVNVMACQLAKKAGVPATIARVRNPEFTMPGFPLSCAELGVDALVHPEKETADAIVRLVRQSSATDLIEFADGKIQLLGVRLEANSSLLNVPLADLVREHGNPPLRIVAIHRMQDTLIPTGNDELLPGDQIFAVCDPAYIPEFVKLAGKKDTRIEDIMILGGGLIGQFVAQSLANELRVKIIESNEAKSQEIADVLSDSLIIHGDGTDIDLLATEGVVDMDAFIAVTGDDETNIISTLLVRHMKVPRTIALVNKVDYLPVTTTIGLDAVVSKQLLTVNAVQRYIHRQRVEAIASLPGIEAQVIEFVAKENRKITRRPLKDIKFPDHALVGAVMQNGNLVIARGDTQIRPGDKVVVFALPEAVDKVEKLFE